MSSRSLRKAQKELEERQQLEKLAQLEEAEEEESDEQDVAPVSKPKPSLFELLGDVDNGSDADADDDDVESEAEAEPVEAPAAAPEPQPKKSKKKKKKGKGKAVSNAPDKAASDTDEIDRALAELNLMSQTDGGQAAPPLTPAATTEVQQLCPALAVDSQHLNANNELRKLFGRAALHDNEDEPERPRQRGRGRQGGLAAAVAGRNTPGDRTWAALGLRRNIFIPGKEEWPRATTGGLSMEVVEKRSDGTVEYRFVHNKAYQDVQKQFKACVASMDPERMVELLRFNPYHISTLLQTSEIAKSERDNATAGDLLERALFTFGRAVHSTFSNNLQQGKARLDFRRPENREFWLAIDRYIATLGARATWRTAFEWAKLMLSLAPEQDPYCMRLRIDQLAMRGREPQNLIDIVESDLLQRHWKIPPNLAFSVALAYDRLKNPTKARSSLRLAISEYPWIAARLCKELDISPIPPSIWGKEPIGNLQELLCQMYVPVAKDLWNTPEATSLLVEVAYSFDKPLGTGEDPYWMAPLDERNLARRVLLSEDRTLINLVDVSARGGPGGVTTSSDPLPPVDSITSYKPVSDIDKHQLIIEYRRLATYFENPALQALGATMPADAQEVEWTHALEAAGISRDELVRNTRRINMVEAEIRQFGGFDE